ncbi:glycosyltransferase family 71 protein [Gonapodya prolifera JEL478]|uniref:Glycosyltransferase family 71 protein n=1 Tax=Gonapodya prolifera (strain JEL478) TaxID=1344416 RepID=A0A139ARP3_GONPJ|nr:glycosyltransferase family 71 protein [Gonapodya prolifera JEL478]|eukprot:KXS19417.1 glycosyltransferase family 71 protein [Gonapodya prolifera JEL478]
MVDFHSGNGIPHLDLHKASSPQPFLFGRRSFGFFSLSRIKTFVASILIIFCITISIGRFPGEVGWDDCTVAHVHVSPHSVPGRSSSYHRLTPIPPYTTLTDFDVPAPLRESLLQQFPAGDSAALGDRVRVFIMFHTRLRALEDHLNNLAAEMAEYPESEINLLPSNVRETFDSFRSFMSRFEEFLFPWLQATSVNYLHTAFSREPRIRGIAICAGNDQTELAMISIRSIRESGSDLPVEVMFSGAGDLSPANRQRILGLGNGYDVTFRDVANLLDVDKLSFKGWAVKPFAGFVSGFAEVLIQDADTIWVGNPEEVFEDPVYKQTGTLFYYDRRTLFPPSAENLDFVLNILPAHQRSALSPFQRQNSFLDGRSAHHMESGVVAFDKSRVHNLYSLLAACKLNGRDERETTYKNVWGDKETFWMGFEMAGFSGLYGYTRWPAVQLGNLARGDQDEMNVVISEEFRPNPDADEEKRKQVRICAIQLGHLNANGSSLLWFNGGPLRNKYHPESAIANPSHLAVETSATHWDLREKNVACLHLPDGTPWRVHDNGTHYTVETGQKGGEGTPSPSSSVRMLNDEEKSLFRKLPGWWGEIKGLTSLGDANSAHKG